MSINKIKIKSIKVPFQICLRQLLLPGRCWMLDNLHAISSGIPKHPATSNQQRATSIQHPAISNQYHGGGK